MLFTFLILPTKTELTQINATPSLVKIGIPITLEDGRSCVAHPFNVVDETWLKTYTMNITGAEVIKAKSFPFNVKSYGAKGDGITDDTVSIQTAINAVYGKGGGTVYLPNGTYLVDADTSIIVKDNIKLRLSDNAVIKALPSANNAYEIIKMTNIRNVEIAGGSIIGDRDEHLGTTGEHGMGIDIRGCTDITISDISISDCWGDGIYIGSSAEQNYCRDIAVSDFVINNNRRQGITLISGKNILIENGTTSNTNGTNPQSGIDIEPNYLDEFLQGIVIKNVNFIDNYNYGLVMGFTHYKDTTMPVDIRIENCTGHNGIEPLACFYIGKPILDFAEGMGMLGSNFNIRIN